MRGVFGLIAFAAMVVPALAAVQVAPATEFDVGWPAILCAVMAGVTLFLLRRKA